MVHHLKLECVVKRLGSRSSPQWWFKTSFNVSILYFLYHWYLCNQARWAWTLERLLLNRSWTLFCEIKETFLVHVCVWLLHTLNLKGIYQIMWDISLFLLFNLLLLFLLECKLPEHDYSSSCHSWYISVSQSLQNGQWINVVLVSFMFSVKSVP